MSDEEDWIIQGIQQNTLKRCPFCGILSELISGCNYVTCICKQGLNGKSEWCWLCGKPKYLAVEGCNEASHNSH